MPRPVILAVDQGTTNTKALAVSLDGEVLRMASVPMLVLHPQPGWAEQSATAIRDGVAKGIATVLEDIPGKDVIAIGISNQRETVVAWDGENGTPIGPAVIWQCRRSAQLCAALRADGREEFVMKRSGLGLDPLFSAGKLRWLLDNQAGARALLHAGKLRMGTVDSWLLWNLTDGAVHATDVSNASRTQLFSLDRYRWDPELAELFGVPISVLPEIHASDYCFGRTRGHFAGLPDGIPIHAMLGDSHAALYGHGIAEVGRVKVTLGTGSSLMCPTPARRASTYGLSETVAWGSEGVVVHALEGNISVSGHAAAFTSQMLGVAGPEALTDLACSVPDSGGVYFVPALAGLGAPHWQQDARGVLSGLSLATTPAHIARATLEGIAHQICDVVAAIEADLGQPVKAIAVDGSAARSDVLLQMLADFSDRTVQRPPQTELSALGVAMMAAKGIGKGITGSLTSKTRDFVPGIGEGERLSRRRAWRLAVDRALLQSSGA